MGVLFTDTFTGTNGTQLSAYGNYTNVTGDMEIHDNGAGPDSAGADSAVRRNDQTPADKNHYVKVTYPADLSTRASTAYAGGACRMSTTANTWVGFYANASGRLFVLEYVSGTLNTLYGTSNTLVPNTVASTVELRFNGDVTNIYIDGVLQDGTGGTTDLRFTTAVTATGQIGTCGYGYDANNTIIDAIEGGDFAAAGAAIDTIDSPVLDAESGNAFTVSGYGSGITSFTIEDVENGSHQINLSASLAGTYTFDMPNVAAYTTDTLGTPFDSTYWSHTATAGDGTDTDTEVVVVNPKSGWARVDVATTPDVASGSVFENFTGFFDTVSAVSVANPSQLTVADTSAWVTGQEVTLAGFTTTPDINGTQVITVVDGTHVSIPVNVTVVTDGTGTMLTGAASEHGQVYYSTSNNTSVAADGTLTTDQTGGSISMLYFDTVDSKWKPFSAVISVLSSSPGLGAGVAKMLAKRKGKR